ncbi:MAG: HD domain-containing protein [Candidatus Omnitrophica bacterium]|nr:HD domain-containing protein [Candidatus Omnitrophota bacterium]
MHTKFEVSLRDLLSSLQTAKLYGTSHQIFKQSVQKAYHSLKEALCEKSEIVVGIVGEELAHEKDILFDLSKILRPIIVYLRNKNIERIVFSQGLEEKELEVFLQMLALSPEEVKRDAQEYLRLSGVQHITVGRLKAPSPTAPLGAQALAAAVSVYESSLSEVSQSLTGIMEEKTLDHLALKFALNNIVENLATQYQDFLKMATIKRYDVATYVHLLNVSILSMYFASKLGFSKEEIREIGVAALFHDIGKLYISRSILTKADQLSDEEFKTIKSHTVVGAEILLRYHEGLGMLPVVVAYEHHLKFDMSGYPRLPFTQKPHMASLIVTICDVYDALSQRRGYKLDYAPNNIYRLMLKERGATFQPHLFDTFYQVMGVWPIGSIVALSDGRIAVVRQENEDDIFAPQVEIIHPQREEKILDLKGLKDTLTIERFLNPWKEGKIFLCLV